MSNICVIGTGYVGLVAIASFAELGHRVTGVDIDEQKIAALRKGVVPFYEPGLDDLLGRQENRERIAFTTDYAEAIPGQDFVFICVNTPPTRGGTPSMRQLVSAAKAIGRHIGPGTIVVNKSTGPVGMVDLIARTIAEHGRREAPPVVANPEFLSQGRAVHDFLSPHQVIIGAYDRAAGEAVARLYEPLGAPITIVSPGAAEMTKLASNAFRAVKVSFANELSAICERLQVDVTEVTGLLSADKAIGPAFLSAGVGWGGNCLPKDVLTLEYVGRSHGVRPRMLQAAWQVNQDQQASVVAKAARLVGADLAGRRVGVLGLAFKGGTDDIRESPAIGVVRRLLTAGASVQAYDPLAMANARRVLGEDVQFCEGPYEAASGAEVLLLLTDWPEFRGLDLAALGDRMAARRMVDGRNVIDPERAAAAGFTYAGVGRGYGGLGTGDGAPQPAGAEAERAA